MIANFAPGLWTPGTPRIPVSLSEILTNIFNLGGSSMSNVKLSDIEETDIKYVHRWWNEKENFGATGIENKVSYSEVLSKFNKRTSEPHEKWFAICLEEVNQPIGIIIVALNHPKEKIISIGSIIVDRKYRRNGYALTAIKELEKWAKNNYSGYTLSLGVFEKFEIAKSFWEACGFEMVRTVETDYIYNGKKQKAYKYIKELK
jgi:RimJ/RimL family protein N-acetyltransferase